MSVPSYEPPPSDPRAALREAIQHSDVSPDIAALRLRILREEVPGAVVNLATIRADDTAIAVSATIGRTGGGFAAAIASVDVESSTSWSAQIRDVEAMAICRALDQLGVTIERALGSGKQASPKRQAAPKAQPIQEKPGDDDAQMAEFSWNSFWHQAREQSITKDDVEAALGRSVQEATPKQALEAVRATGAWKK